MSTGAHSALGIGGLPGARLAIRLMTGLDGTTVLDIPQIFLVAPAALETTGQQILVATNYSPAELGDVNPFQQAPTLVVDGRGRSRCALSLPYDWRAMLEWSDDCHWMVDLFSKDH